MNLLNKLKTNKMEKTLTNTTASQAKDNVKDIVFWGDGNTFKLISKASSVAEGWMKSTKAMEIEGVGCVVQVTTQQTNKTGMTIPTPKTIVNGITTEWFNINECAPVCTSAVAEALTFVPGVKIEEYTIAGIKDGKDANVSARRLVKI